MPRPPKTPRAGAVRRDSACCGLVFAWLACAPAEEVADTKFSVDRGFFEEPFLLEITSATPGATVRFTTDGSVPTLSRGQTYTGPLLVAETSVVRAAAFKAGLEPTDVDTHTYLFLAGVLTQDGEGFPPTWGSYGDFDTEPGDLPPGPYPADYAVDPDIVGHPEYGATILDDLRSIPSLCLALDPDDLFSAAPLRSEGGEVVEARGIYPVGKGFERAASAELILPDGSTGFQIDCSVEVQGATSTDRWKTDKLSMRLKFKAPYGPSELDYPLFGDDATDSINTVILDSTNQQSWTHPDPAQQLRAQYLRDQLVGDLQNAMGGIAPHGRYAHVYLDGLYWGVYWLHEFVEEGFVTAYRGGEEEDYDILRHRADNVVAGSADGFAALLEAVAGDLADPADYQAVADKLDIAAFADYMLCNFYAGNADWAFQNWNASAHRSDPARKWLFHNWDAEKTFQFVTDDNTGADDPDSPTAIHQRLRASAEYRLAFADRAHRHLFNGGVLTPAAAVAAYESRAAMLDRAIVGESARWGDNRNPGAAPYTRETWLAEGQRLREEWFPGRTAVLLAQLEADGLYPATAAPVFSQHGGEVAGGTVLGITAPGGGTLFYTTDGSDPRGASALQGAAHTITGSVRVKARARSAGGEWSALTEALFSVPGSACALRVVELMFNPAGPSPGERSAGFDDADLFEFVELRNSGASDLELAGIAFTEGVTFTFAGGVLAPGERVIIVNDLAAFEARYGAGLAVAGEYGGTLSNAGETLALATPFGEELQRFTYADEIELADGGGHSIAVLDEAGDPASWDEPTFWRPSALPGGSPGAAAPALPPFVISELHYHPREPDEPEEFAGFTDEEQFEFIEVLNAGPAAADLDGCALSEGVEFAFGPLVLAPGGRAVVVADAAAFARRYGGGVAVAGEFAAGTLNNSGERLVFTGAAGEVVHDFVYEDSWQPATDGPGASLVIRDVGASPDRWVRADAWTASAFAGGSPGVAEPLASASPFRITEVMFNPPEPSAAESAAGFGDNDDFEFVELTNIGTAPLNLAGHRFAGGVSFQFPAIAIDPGERAVVVKDEEAFVERYGTDDPVIGEYGGNLSNDGEAVELEDGGGLVVLQFSYEDGWYDSADGGGRSLEIVDAGAHRVFWGVEEGWRPGPVAGGPGLAEDAYDVWAWSAFEGDEEAVVDPAIGGANADPDADGLSNFLEFALATAPLVHAPDGGWGGSLMRLSGQRAFVFVHRLNPAATGVGYHVEFSVDGRLWEAADLLGQIHAEADAVDGSRWRAVVAPGEGGGGLGDVGLARLRVVR